MKMEVKPALVRTVALRAFGQRLEAMRQAKGLTQQQLANALPGNGQPVSQSYVARLEKGEVGDPSPELIARMAQTLAKDPTEWRDIHLALLADAVTDKYGVANDLLFPLYQSPITFEEMATWEQAQSELWLCVPRFIDRERAHFREAVQAVLRKKGGKVTYFLPQTREEEFEAFRALMFEHLDREPDLSLFGVYLDRFQEVFLVGGLTIANPVLAETLDKTTARPSGYLTLSDAFGEFRVAIKLPLNDVLERIKALRDLRTKKLAEKAMKQ